jgi:hypothetical protein
LTEESGPFACCGYENGEKYLNQPSEPEVTTATEKQEICYEMEWETTYADLLSSINEKELLNQLLKGGEYTTPLQLTSRADVYGGNRSTIYSCIKRRLDYVLSYYYYHWLDPTLLQTLGIFD